MFFGKKKKEPASQTCCCQIEGTGDPVVTQPSGRISSIKVLGMGCASCHEQFENAKDAVSRLGLTTEVEYVTDLEKIMSYGVMSMPAVVVNEKPVSVGKVLSAADMEKLLKNANP